MPITTRFQFRLTDPSKGISTSNTLEEEITGSTSHEAEEILRRKYGSISIISRRSWDARHSQNVDISSSQGILSGFVTDVADIGLSIAGEALHGLGRLAKKTVSSAVEAVQDAKERKLRLESYAYKNELDLLLPIQSFYSEEDLVGFVTIMERQESREFNHPVAVLAVAHLKALKFQYDREIKDLERKIAETGDSDFLIRFDKGNLETVMTMSCLLGQLHPEPGNFNFSLLAVFGDKCIKDSREKIEYLMFCGKLEIEAYYQAVIDKSSDNELMGEEEQAVLGLTRLFLGDLYVTLFDTEIPEWWNFSEEMINALNS